MIPSWIITLGTALALLGGVFSAGWAGHAYKAHRAALAAQLQASENNREAERLAGKQMTRISDALAHDRLATDRHAAGLQQRLRDLAAQAGPAPGCPSGDDDPRPAAAVLSDAARTDLVQLAREADIVADRLRACQAVAARGEAR